MRRGDERTQEIDVIIGQKVRSLRKLKGINQNDFAKLIGVTFQQLQKYELATNRISCSRLVVIAEALGVEPTIFYEDVSKKSATDIFSDEEIRMVAKLRKMPKSVSKHFFGLIEEL